MESTFIDRGRIFRILLSVKQNFCFFFSFFDSCMLHIEIFVANRRPSEIFVSLGHFQVLEVWFDSINEKRTTVPKRTDTLYRDWVSV